jgi:hypothetical protein
LKKPVAATLLFLLFTAQAGYYFIYTIHQYIIKEEIEKQLLADIPDSSLELIIAEQFAGKMEWKEKGKEFSLNGVMYDIVRIKKSGGKTLLYCINDKKEKQLIEDLVKAVSGNHNSKQDRSNVKSPLSDFFFMNHEEGLNIVSEPSAYTSLIEKVISSFEEINIPPPKA